MIEHLRCLTWNWRYATGYRLRILTERTLTWQPDVVCYTEVLRSTLPAGYCLEPGADYGYGEQPERRKVVLWSRWPWQDVDVVGDPALPSGRFVSGITAGVRFVGVCIPWKDAHVRSGRRDSKPWQDHITYCQHLGTILRRYDTQPVCLLGDFNQYIPRRRQPQAVFAALQAVLPSDYAVATAGLVNAEGKHLIEHIVLAPALQILEPPTVFPRFDATGKALSDHVGVGLVLATADAMGKTE